jgi:tetratricopeptide (TPR) repeat protein
LNGGAPPQASLGWLILEKLPLLALSAACAAVTMMSQKAGGAVTTIQQASPLLRFETALVSYVHYLGKTLWPANLVLLYPQPTQLYSLWTVAAAALLLTGITAAVLGARRRRYLTVGWLWFLGALVPMIGFVRVGAQAMPDHFAYLPLLGLFLMWTWLIGDWAKDRRVSARWIAVPAAAVLLVFGALTYKQLGHWRDSESIWTHTLALTENNSVAHDELGNYLSDGGHIEEAAAHFRAANAILPGDLEANLGLGAYEHAHGNLRAAIERYEIVARHAAQPRLRAAAYGNLGSAYRELGDLPDAKQCFEKSLELMPDQPMSMVGLGLVAQKSGDFDEAVRQYSRAMAIQPTDVGFLLIASALDRQGHADQANAIRERVAHVSKDVAAAEKEAQSLLGQ